MTNPADKLSLLMATPNEEPVSQYKGVVQQTDDSKAYVLIDGGTAVWCDTMDVKALVGDRVRVEVRKHKGTLVANYTHPVTDDAVANVANDKATEALGKVETLEVDALKADSAVIKDLQADAAKVHDLTADQLSAATAYVGELTAGEVTAQSIIADKAKLAQVDTDQLHADHAVIEALDSTYASIDNLNAATARIGNIEADYLVAADMTAEQARVGQLMAGKADVADLTAANGRIDTLESTKADISTLESDYITAEAIEATYLHADMSNADVAWIQNGVIKDASISDAQIIGVSANKLTAGTIDASNINVTNLRADNLKVTRINGQPVIGGYALVDPSSSGYSSKNPKAQGWYELSGSSYVATSDTSVVSGKNYYSTSDYAELYDQDAIDGMVDSLNNRIDAQIETWTTDAVPTLNNYPASSWTTSDARAEHVGDICYVMNAGNDYDGYTYRFAYDNSTSSYKWVLIKDNQVTAALGRISDLETFESETSTWIDETDEGLRTIRSNHTALAGRVDKVVKSSVQLWYTKANETAPSAPNSVVTSTSTSGNGWRTVVPTYNSSYPFYFYCWQYQYEDGTYDWSAVVYDRATSESEERARTGVTNAASAQTTANGNIKSSVQLWFTKANDTAPSKPSGTNPITVSDASKRNQWNLVVPTYSDSYPYYFYCYQQQKGDNTYQWTDVVYDEATSTAMKKAQEALPSSTFTTFEQTTFKEVVDDVDEQSTKITTLTTITENNGLTETTNISNTVNQVSQTASGNSAKLSNITETIGANADGTNPSTKSLIARTSAVEQTLEGFQTTVTNVQRTAEEANDRGVAYSGTSSTGASTADKVAACTNFELVAGATVTVRFSAANTSTGAITLNVNNTGKRTVYVNGAATSSSNQLLWGANANVTFTYDGSYWRIVSEPRPWVGSCSVAAGTAAKTATINEVVICKGTSVTLNMTYSNTSTSATLNVTSTGAKNIYYGTTSTRPTTENGYGWTDASTQTFVFDGAYWRIGDTSALAGLATANGILSSHTSQISQNAQNIEMKANSSEVYTKTQTDGLITSEVEARNAAIKVSADSITQRVSEEYATKAALETTDGNVTNLTGRVSTAESSITQNARDISLRVTKTEFESLEIGGRNLSPESLWEEGFLQNSNTTELHAEDTHKERTSGLIPVTAGDLLTFQAWVDDTTGWDTWQPWLGYRFYSDESTPIGSRAAKYNTTKTNYVSYIGVEVPSDATLVRFSWRHYGASRSKLEKGNKPTDWSPAPEDLEGRMYNAETRIDQNAEAITFRATKTEANQMARPNLAPIGSVDFSSVYNATTSPNGYWRNTPSPWFTKLEDGWVHCYRDNTSGTAAANTTSWRPSPSPSVEAGKVYTILTEIRNNNSSGSSQTDMYLQQIANNQFWGDINGATIDDDHVTTTTNISLRSCGETYVRYSYRIADTEHLTTAPVELFRYNFRLPAGGKFDFDFRQSVYEGIYDGPYKPYVGAQLYASQAELKVAADGITSTVSSIASAKYVNANAASWPLASLKIYAAEGHSENWNVTSTDGLRVGDTVYVKGTDGTRTCTVYIKTTVTAINSATNFTGTSHGYEDVLPVESIKSTINQSSDSVKIQARHVEIDGEAIFSSIKDDVANQTALEHSSSGTSIAMDDAATASLKALTIYGESVQDGTPTPNAPVPISSVTGNLYRETVYAIGQTWTAGAITVTKTAYSSYVVNGTSTGTHWLWGGGSSLDARLFVTLPAGTYTAVLGGNGAANCKIAVRGNVNGSHTTIATGASPQTFTLTEETPVKAAIYTNSGKTFTNSEVSIQLYEGSSAIPVFVPYDSIGLWVHNDETESVTPIPLNGHELRSLPDGTHDELTVDADGHVTMVQRVGSYTFPTSGITDNGDLGTYYRGTISILASDVPEAMASDTTTANGYCTVSTVAAGWSSDTQNVYYDAKTRSDRTTFVVKAPVDSLSELNAAYAGADFTYPLATPQTIDLGTIDMPQVHDGDTVEVIAALTPSIDATWWSTSGKVVADNVTVIDGGRIRTGSVTANQIAAGTITGDEIAGGTITSDNIAAGAISADRLDANALTLGNIEGLEDRLDAIDSGLSSISTETQWVHYDPDKGTVFGENGSANNLLVTGDGIDFNTDEGRAAWATGGVFHANEMEAETVEVQTIVMGNWALVQSGTSFYIDYIG